MRKSASPKLKPPKQDDPNQSKRFEEAARLLGADESGAAFTRAMDVLVPKKNPPKPGK